MTPDPITIIAAYYDPRGRTHALLHDHACRVAGKALAAARCVPHLNPDLEFIHQAALLHDIGIFLTHAPGMGCIGRHPYVCHGVLGAEILRAWRLPKHAAVCERHVGAGLSATEIRTQGLPLPERDMLPVTIEETIIAYADKFFSKLGPAEEKPAAEIAASLARYTPAAADRFLAWHDLFGGQ